jgi:hypothetical protein
MLSNQISSIRNLDNLRFNAKLNLKCLENLEKVN